MPSSELEKKALALVQEKRDVSVKFNNQILDYGMRDQNQQAQALLQGAAAAAMDQQQPQLRQLLPWSAVSARMLTRQRLHRCMTAR